MGCAVQAGKDEVAGAGAPAPASGSRGKHRPAAPLLSTGARNPQESPGSPAPQESPGLGGLGRVELGGVRCEAGLELSPDRPGLDAEGSLVDAGEAGRLESHRKALAGGHASAASLARTEHSLPLPLPLALSDIEKEAGARHGLGARHVRDSCQRRSSGRPTVA